jgi:hypothetical protein
MKSIVVYKITILSCFLLLSTGLMAQKPAIDLISSHHKYRHPESIIDTLYTVHAPEKEAVLQQLPSEQDQKTTVTSKRKKRRQIGPSLDSLFHKEEGRDSAREKSPAKISFFDKRINPIKFLIYITALK